MKLAVLILNYNTKDLLRSCLKSLFQYISPETNVFVIDNASIDGSVEMVKKFFPNVGILENRANLGYSAGNNVGLKKIKSDAYLLLNSDTLVLENTLKKLRDFSGKNNFGIVSCRLEFKNGKFQPNAGELPFGISLLSWVSGIDGLFDKLKLPIPSFHQNNETFYKNGKKVGWVSGTAMLIKSQTINKIGFLDENIFMYGEDVEYCFRAKRNGIETGWTDEATIVHLQGGSSTDPNFRQWLGEFKGIIYLYKKYFGNLSALFIDLLIRIFILIRIILFFLIGKINISKIYGKVFINL